MEFPITRDRLRTIAKELEEQQNQEFVNDRVEFVKNAIFLKAYYDCESKNKRFGTQYDKQVLSRESPKNMLKFNLPLQPSGYFSQHSTTPLLHKTLAPPYNEWNTFLPLILERLRILFPDVSFQVDPLKTYLLIDWS